MEYDVLRAAQDQAFWTAWAAGAAVFGLIAIPLNVIGLYVLWRQLRLTAEAAEDAKAATIAAVASAEATLLRTRPWVALSWAPDGALRKHRRLGTWSFIGTFRFENIGQTPALSVRPGFGLVENVEEDGPYNAEEIVEMINQDYGRELGLYPGKPDGMRVQIGLSESDACSIAIGCFYRIPGRSTSQRTIEVWWIEASQPTGVEDNDWQYFHVRLGRRTDIRIDPT